MAKLLLKNTTETRSLFFIDDIFGLDFEWLKDFLRLYRQRVGLEFSCMVRADVVRKHKDYAKLLKDSASPLHTKDIKKIVNLQRFFQTAVLWPRTFPLIKLLIKLPPNFIFNLWFGFIFYIVYTKSEGRSWWKTFLFALKNYRSTTRE